MGGGCEDFKNIDKLHDAFEFWSNASDSRIQFRHVNGSAQVSVLACNLDKETAGRAMLPIPSSFLWSSTVAIRHDHVEHVSTITHELGHIIGLEHPHDSKYLGYVTEEGCVPSLMYESFANQRLNGNFSKCDHPSLLDIRQIEEIQKKVDRGDYFEIGDSFASPHFLRDSPVYVKLFLHGLLDTYFNAKPDHEDYKKHMELLVNALYIGLTYAISGPSPAIVNAVSVGATSFLTMEKVTEFLSSTPLHVIPQLLQKSGAPVALSLAWSFISAAKYTNYMASIIDSILQCVTQLSLGGFSYMAGRLSGKCMFSKDICEDFYYEEGDSGVIAVIKISDSKPDDPYALEEIVIYEAESDVQPIQDITHKYVNRMSLGDVGVNAFIENPEYNAVDPNSLHPIFSHDCTVESFVRDCRRPTGNGYGSSESEC